MIPIERLKELTILNNCGNCTKGEIVQMAHELLALRQQVKDKDLQIKEWREDNKRLKTFAYHEADCMYFQRVLKDAKCDCGYADVREKHNALLEKYPEEE